MSTTTASFHTVLAYFDADTAMVCADCMRDAQRGGLRMMATRVPVGKFECDYCHQRIGR